MGIAVILALAASTPFVKGMEWTVPMFLVWLALTTFFYFLRVRGSAHQSPTADL